VASSWRVIIALGGHAVGIIGGSAIASLSVGDRTDRAGNAPEESSNRAQEEEVMTMITALLLLLITPVQAQPLPYPKGRGSVRQRLCAEWELLHTEE
jgi:hypothetical protein